MDEDFALGGNNLGVFVGGDLDGAVVGLDVHIGFASEDLHAALGDEHAPRILDGHGEISAHGEVGVFTGSKVYVLACGDDLARGRGAHDSAWTG